MKRRVSSEFVRIVVEGVVVRMVVVKVVIRVMDFRLCEDFWGLMDRDMQTNEDMNRHW